MLIVWCAYSVCCGEKADCVIVYQAECYTLCDSVSGTAGAIGLDYYHNYLVTKNRFCW